MKVLHIFRSEPNDMVRQFIKGMSQGDTNQEAQIYKGAVDYAKLVKDIFDNDKVICWW